MSKHHHHPHEGHVSGNATPRPLRHNWFFYVAGLFLLLALIGFVLEGFPSLRSGAPLPPQPPLSADSKR